MAPTPLTPISEESLPNYPEMKIRHDNNNSASKNSGEDQGCLYFYDRPEPKGSFQEDSFFKNAQLNYEKAVEDMMSNRGTIDASTGAPENLSAYRNLCQDGDKQDSRASGLTDLGQQYQIVLDVTSYSPADISVKAVGDQELMVEGRRVETKSDGSTVNQSFSRRFCLPGLVKLDAVASALSSDGVLTVTAPKMAKAINNSCNKAINGQPPTKQDYAGSFSNASVLDDISKSHGIQNSIFNEKDNLYTEEFGNFLNDVDLENRMKYQMGFSDGLSSTTIPSDDRKLSASSDMVEEDQEFKITLDTTGYGPKDISVKAVGDKELLVEGKHTEKNESGAETSQSFSRRFCLPELVKLDAVRSSLSSEGILTITAPKMVVKTQPKLRNQEEIPRFTSKNISSSNATNFSSAQDDIPQFHDNTIDDFFGKKFDMASNMNCRKPSLFMENARNDYNESLKNMMNRNWVMESEAPSFFNNPSPSLKTAETGSSRPMSDIMESASDYKMKLDVSQYSPEDISVKSVGERELIIEGKHVDKKQSGGVSHSFSRRFCLPGVAQMEAVKSSLSADGTLTITAPKKMITQ